MKKGRLVILPIAVLFILILVSIKPVKNFISDFSFKNEESYPGENRKYIYPASLNAAREGGLSGIGYGLSSIYIILPDKSGSRFENDIYFREKSSSILALIEETGILGIILFLAPVTTILFLSFAGKRKKSSSPLVINNPDNIRVVTGGFSMNLAKLFKLTAPENMISILFASFIFSAILYAQMEAYWVGPGSCQLPLFFIYIGGLLALCDKSNVVSDM